MNSSDIISKFKVNYSAFICGEPVSGEEPVCIPVDHRLHRTRQFCAEIGLCKAGEPSDRGISEATLRDMLCVDDNDKLHNDYQFELRTGGKCMVITRGHLTKCVGGWWIINRWGANKDNIVKIPNDMLDLSIGCGIFLFINNKCIARIDNPLSIGKRVRVYDNKSAFHFWYSNKRSGSSAYLSYNNIDVIVSGMVRK